jgi:predicted RND superfamily exporter protein
LTWLFSDIRLQSNLGLLLGLLVLLNILGALILLPVLFRSIRPYFITKGIPLKNNAALQAALMLGG